MQGGFDVIVLGLGPIGAAATICLSRGGARVLVLDARPLRDKPCGGCISVRAMGYLDHLEPPAWLKA
ncbi:hypothetical protein DFAR_1970003 [Desulfarculales bacterium]